MESAINYNASLTMLASKDNEAKAKLNLNRLIKAANFKEETDSVLGHVLPGQVSPWCQMGDIAPFRVANCGLH